MINDNEVERIGTMGRNSWHGLKQALQDEETMVLRIDGILVPWRIDKWDMALTERYAGCEVYRLADENEDEDDIDLIGYEVVGYGRIVDIDGTTMNILAELEDGRVIPLHEDLIVDIDDEAKTLTMNLPEGL